MFSLVSPRGIDRIDVIVRNYGRVGSVVIDNKTVVVDDFHVKVVVAVVGRIEMVVIILIGCLVLIKRLIFHFHCVHTRSRYCCLLLGCMVLKKLDINLLSAFRSFGMS